MLGVKLRNCKGNQALTFIKETLKHKYREYTA